MHVNTQVYSLWELGRFLVVLSSLLVPLVVLPVHKRANGMGLPRVAKPTKLQPVLEKLVSMFLLDVPRVALLFSIVLVDFLPRILYFTLEPVELV